ncbi:hypothetical protein Mapa_015542 [Marchantia paleacea]|nr:hypothetical protein Mapa_015542 [Marchantia paleacea]
MLLLLQRWRFRFRRQENQESEFLREFAVTPGGHVESVTCLWKERPPLRVCCCRRIDVQIFLQAWPQLQWSGDLTQTQE